MSRHINKKRHLPAADGFDASADFYRQMEKEEADKKEVWKLKTAAGAPATTQTEPASIKLRLPTTGFVVDMGECLIFGATCHKCALHTYFWFPEKYASRPHVDLAKGTWTPTYQFDMQYVKCGNCMGDVETEIKTK